MQQECHDTTFHPMEPKVMRTWLGSLVNAILSKVPGKTSWPDTATLWAMAADFRLGRAPAREALPTFVRTPEGKRTIEEQK
jgi:hypothetical protein